MANLEETMNGLETQIEFMDYTGNGFAYTSLVMRDALELLKAQQEKIKELETIIENMKETI